MGRRMLTLCGWGLLLASGVAAAAEPADDSQKTEETKAEVKWSAFEHVDAAGFNKALEEREYNTVAFVIPKDFNSEMLEWDWPAIKEKEPEVISINCEDEAELCLEQDIRHYPALRVYRTGKLFARYRGPRKADAVVDFIRRTRIPVVGGITSTNLTSFAQSDDVNFVLHLRAEDAGKGLYKRFHDLAEEFHDRASFGVISRTEDGSIDEEGDDAPSVLRCYNNADDTKKSLYHFFDDTVGLRNFVLRCMRKLIQPMNKLNHQVFTEGEHPVLYYFDSEIPAREAFSVKMKPVARKYADLIQIVSVDPLTFPEVVNMMTLKWEFPAMAIQVPADKTISLYSHGDIDEEIVEKFIKDILRLNPPEEENDGQPPVDEGIVMEDDNKHDQHDEL